MSAPLTTEEFQSLVLFSGVSPDMALPLLEGAEVRTLEAGVVLLSPERDNDSLYLVLSGVLGVRRGGVSGPELRVVVRGESVGELSLIDNDRPSLWVVAKETGRLLVISRERFWKLVEHSVRLAQNLLTQISKWLKQNTRQLDAMFNTVNTLERETRMDPLTGVYNRRWLSETLERHLHDHHQRALPLSVILLDVDHFKKYNDTLGHPAGDRALITLAKALSGHVGLRDEVARYGGEEFVVVLPGVDREQGLAVAERLRLGVANREIRDAHDQPLPSVTISQGLATLMASDTPATLLSRADQFLYQAKKNGRNRVEG
ncbi:MAG: GGDEF domain-containing protein [Magnetococcus sp. WYHC-3]